MNVGPPLPDSRGSNPLAPVPFDEYNLTRSPPRVSILELSTPLLGRKWELDQILAILNRRSPALIVIAGAPGVGKSRLLRAVRGRAAERGWKIAPQPGGQLAVKQHTTRSSFCQEVESALPAQAPERFESGVSDDRTRGVALGEPSQQRSPSEGPRVEPQDPDRAHVSDDAGASILLARLRQHEPLLVVVDDYSPDAQFETWFLESIVGDLEGSASAIVVIVGTEREWFEDPRAQVVPLAALDRTEVREHFEALVGQLSPPAGEAELARYVEAACETPAVIDSLERVLKMARGQTA